MADFTNIAIPLGSIYLGDEAMRDPMYSSGYTITLGDSVPHKTLTWLNFGKKLVPTSSICHGLTWKTLNEAGFIDGTKVTMDGLDFLCRIPRIHRDDSEPIYGMRAAQLWDNRPAEDETGLLMERAQDGCLAAPTTYDIFWVKVLGKKGMDCRDSSWIGDDHIPRFCGAFRQKSSLAWMPVLEPMNQADPGANIGKEMKLVVPGTIIQGVPTEANEYDLLVRVSEPSLATLSAKQNAGRGVWWSPVEESVIAMDKAKIIHSVLI